MKKDYILQEIQRTAKENGGVPLGQQRFSRETGIKQSDWLGKFWARWGDALREAGFAPNQLQGAFDETLLLEKYVALVRELGHIPASGDLRLKARRDPEFPSHNTYGRFGSKSDLVRRLSEFCRKRTGYEDVVRICEEYAPAKKDVPEELEPRDNEIGFVYLIKSGRFYKIGRTNAAGRRERELALQLPEEAKTVHVIRTDDPSGIETYWHKRFEAKRKKGEWFDLNAADISAFKRRKFM
ncbi:MAG: GIY-YIG nuclease family protein [Nitrospiraceae bacterium]|nr:GIY-YIG nuclease family protein [Nitrospiraceae bacterium]